VAKNSPCPSIEIRSGLEPGADTSDKYSRCVPDDNCVKLGYDPSLPTNRNLIAFLEQHFDLKLRKYSRLICSHLSSPEVWGAIFHSRISCGQRRSSRCHRFELFDQNSLSVSVYALSTLYAKLATTICHGSLLLHALSRVHSRLREPACGARRTPGGQGSAMRNARRTRVTGDWRRMKCDVDAYV